MCDNIYSHMHGVIAGIVITVSFLQRYSMAARVEAMVIARNDLYRMIGVAAAALDVRSLLRYMRPEGVQS